MSKLTRIATLAAIAMACSARLAIATPAIEGAAPHVSASAGLIVAKANKKSDVSSTPRTLVEASESHSDQSGTRDSRDSAGAGAGSGSGRSSEASESHTESHNESHSESHSEGHSESHGSDHH
jgi:hypothetical protein